MSAATTARQAAQVTINEKLTKRDRIKNEMIVAVEGPSKNSVTSVKAKELVKTYADEQGFWPIYFGVISPGFEPIPAGEQVSAERKFRYVYRLLRAES